MRVVLRKDVPGVGRAGEVKDVADGHARNHLLPRGLASEASAGELHRVAQARESAKAKKEREHAEAQALAARLGEVSLVFQLKVGPQGKAFGSITDRDIAEGLRRRGFEVPREKIQLGEPIRSLGPHSVELKLLGDVRARIVVAVEAAAA